MKFALLLTLLFTQVALADSIREVKIREQMLERVDLLTVKSELTRADLKKKDVVSACTKIKEMFVIFPDHLKAVGTHMDLFKNRTIKAKDEVLSQLIFIHKQVNICNSGKDSEYVDPKALTRELKDLESELRKQRRLIKRSDTSHENNFYYEYQF